MAERRFSIRRLAKAAEAFVRLRLRNAVTGRWRGWRHRALPTVMVTGTCGKTTTSRLTASILEAAGHVVGLATTDGVFVDGDRVAAGDLAGHTGHALVLADRRVTAAVLETARGELIRRGLCLSSVTASALTNLGSDHIGTDGIDSIDDMARLKAQVTDAARRSVVLNADDARCLALAGRYGVAKTILFAARADHPALRDHVAAGGRAVAGEDGVMRLYQAGRPPADIVVLADVPVTMGGRAAPYVADAMAAAALALAIDVPVGAVAAGLAAFAGGLAQNPGRFTKFSGFPFTLVADHAKNALGLAATLPMLDDCAGAGRRIIALTAAGNRADRQYDEVARTVAGRFDHYVVYRSAFYRRGRAAGAITRHLVDGLVAAGVPRDVIDIATGSEEGFGRAAALARPGDTVLLLAKFPKDHAAIAEAFGLPMPE